MNRLLSMAALLLSIAVQGFGQDSHLAPNCAPPTCSATSDAPVKLSKPEPLKDGDICIIHNGVCEKVAGAYSAYPSPIQYQTNPPMPVPDVTSTLPLSKSLTAQVCTGDCPKPEPMDVPAIRFESFVPQLHYDCPPPNADDRAKFTKEHGNQVGIEKYCFPHDPVQITWSCKNTHRIKLQDESGAWHCLLFPKEKP